MDRAPRSDPPSRVRFETILAVLRRQSFAVLSTVAADGTSHSAGVTYGVSRPGRPLILYVMTRRHLQKARNIAANPSVSLVVPVMRRLPWFLPPPCLQLRGRAEILDWNDADGQDVFDRFWLGRRILGMYRQSHRRGETRICFLRITPDPVIRSYMVGQSLWELRKRMESGLGKVSIPPEYRVAETPSEPGRSLDRAGGDPG